MTDTHTHLYMDAFSAEEADAVARAVSAGVSRMVFPGVSPASHEAMMTLHLRFPENTRVAIGLHPTEVGEDWEEVLDGMERHFVSGDFCAVGEIGIDKHWDVSGLENQKKAFSRQLGWAVRHHLPVIIHCRDGVDETLEVIRSVEGELPPLVFHSFTSGVEDVRKIHEVCDPYFGINGVVSFKNAGELREAIPEIGVERILLETDAPYLAPVPHRGTRNESAYIPLILNKVAETLGQPPEHVERITDENADRLFFNGTGS